MDNMTRGEIFANNEFYHVYNRGVDKRSIFGDEYDVQRFYQSMDEFNCVEPIGSIFENQYKLGDPTSKSKSDKLVGFVAYCLNPNHYHFILEQLVDNGISMFMKRLGGYTQYFNEKYERSGSLFQGKYKVRHIGSTNYLLHLSAYVNLNYEVHNLGDPRLLPTIGRAGRSTSKFKLTKSSWGEYIGDKNSENFCKKEIVLDQFKSTKEYEIFAKEALGLMREKKDNNNELKSLAMEE